MKRYLLFSLLLSMGGALFGQAKNEVPPIEIVSAGTGVEGTYLVQLSVVTGKTDVPKEVLKKWGIYSILFNGVAAGEKGSLAQPPLVREKNSLTDRSDFWNVFFELKKGAYRNFALVAGEQFQMVRLPSKKCRISAILSVSKEKLWNYLKHEGLVQDVFETNQAFMMKPTVMVVPSNVWCKENGFLRRENDLEFPDYRLALNSSMDLQNVISKINILMSERNFPLENLETVIKDLEFSEVENAMLQSQESGANLQETSLDRLYRQSKSDIVLQLTWGVNKVGAKHSVTFNLQALDSYTHKQIAGVQGTGAASFAAEIPVLLEEAVLSQMDNFTYRLTNHFEDMRANGREIALDVRLFDADINFETEYGEDELAEIITRWLSETTVNRHFSRAPSTATMLQFKEVRIPLVDENGQAMDAYSFARNLARFLKKPPCQLAVKVVPRGLGKAIVVIGEK